jgi:transposase InsO family protein
MISPLQAALELAITACRRLINSLSAQVCPAIGKVRNELLNGELLDPLMEAEALVEGWRKEYNRVRPHSSLGFRPPATEACEVGKFSLG